MIGRIDSGGRFLLAALLLLATFASPALAQDVTVQITGASLDTLVLADSAGRTLGPAAQTFGALGPETVEDARFEIANDWSAVFTMPRGASLTLHFRSAGRPITIATRYRSAGVVDRYVVYRDVQIPLDAAGRVGVGGDLPAVAVDADGDGSLESSVDPSAVLEGAAADDETPPSVEHARLADGSHALTLVDDGEDVTALGRLFYSTDGGERYLPYDGPIPLDPHNTPVLHAIGEDVAGNTSKLFEFATARGFCARVQDDRAAVRAIVAAGLGAAVDDGWIGSPSQLGVLAVGDAACLWRTDASGEDASCAACAGVYRAQSSPLRVLVTYPAALFDDARDAVQAHLVTAADAEPRLTTVRFDAVRADAFATGDIGPTPLFATPVDPVASGRLAPRLTVLGWALGGEYLTPADGEPALVGPSLDGIVTTLRDAGMPATEGHEAALRAHWQLLASNAMLRIAGAGRGARAAEPERDSYDARALRVKLESAARARAEAALGVLATEPCPLDAQSLFASRAAYHSNACDGTACRSLEDYAAARAALALESCPGLFDGSALDALALGAAISVTDPAALAPLLADDCAANAWLGSSLQDIRALAARLVPAYDDALAALAGSDPAARADRLVAGDVVADAIAAAQERAVQPLKLRIANRATSPIEDLVLRMYVDDTANGQQVDLLVPASTALVIEGDPALAQPFYLDVSLVDVQAYALGHVAFVLDPENVHPSSAAGRRIAGLQYYVLDPEEARCPRPYPVIAPVSQ